MPSDPIDYDAIEQAAKKATPGPWDIGRAGNCNVVKYDGDGITGVAFTHEQNRAYLALLDPATVLRLVERARRADVLEAHVREWRSLDCPCCGNEGAWADSFTEETPLACGCKGHVAIDADYIAYVSVDDDCDHKEADHDPR